MQYPGEYLQEEMKVVQDLDSEKYGRDVQYGIWMHIEYVYIYVHMILQFVDNICIQYCFCR